MAKRPMTQGRGVKPADVRVTQPTGHSDVLPSFIAADGTPMIQCMCGCGTWFKPLRPNHRFIEDHRFVTYQSHACPDCGSTHRIAVKR